MKYTLRKRDVPTVICLFLVLTSLLLLLYSFSFIGLWCCFMTVGNTAICWMAANL